MAKVLVAEDERYTRDLLVDTLVYAGHEVIEAKNGGSALGLAFDEHPDLILLDVMMPVMDGFEVLRRLRGPDRETPDMAEIPVILVSGLSPEEGEQAALSLGASHYITKPWEPGMVEAAVGVALRESGFEVDDGIEVSDSGTAEARPLVKTGNAVIDQSLSGGQPQGSLTLIEGTTSSGKSVVGQHLVYGSLLDGNSVAYFVSEHSAKGVIPQMESLGLDVSRYLQEGGLRIYPIGELTSRENPERLMNSLAQDIQRLPRKYNVIVVDSLTDLVSYSTDGAVIGFFSFCKGLCNEGKDDYYRGPLQCL